MIFQSLSCRWQKSRKHEPCALGNAGLGSDWLHKKKAPGS